MSNRSIDSVMDHMMEITGPLIAACYSDVISVPYPSDGLLYCNATTDQLFGACWNYTLAGTLAETECPPIPGFKTEEFVTRNCSVQGEWSKANYGPCLGGSRAHPDEDNSYINIYMYICGFSISLVMLIVSVFIFFRFRQLRCHRITVHKNLFISYIFTGITWTTYYSLVAFDGDVQVDNPTWCKVLHVIATYFTVCNFAWVFCEGLYLHTIMVRAFSSGKKLLKACYAVGWGVPFVLVGVYAGLRAAVQKNDDRNCWFYESTLQWIFSAPIIASMIINVIFLCNIVRLLATKLRQIPDGSQTRKTARATLLLIPLLGIQFLLVPLRPVANSDFMDAYTYLIALTASLQGAFVSLMYCFLNSEVISLLKRKWHQRRVMVGDKRNTSTIATTSYALVDQPSSAYQTTVT